MNYYPFHLGDYAAHTAHLDMLEDLAYRRLLDLYYMREAPILTDINEAARLIRMKGQVEQVDSVLNEFFDLSPDGWRHRRCDEEIGRMQDKQAKARLSAGASVKARQANAERTLNERSTNANDPLNGRSTKVELPTPTPTPTPIPISTSSLCSEVDAPSPSDAANKSVRVKRPDDVSSEIWRDFLALRKAKRSPLTPKSFEGMEREAQKAGITIAEALIICIERGWQGFQASWDWKRTAHRKPAVDNFAGKDYGKGGDL